MARINVILHEDGIVLLYDPNKRVRKAVNRLVYNHEVNIFDNSYSYQVNGKFVKLYKKAIGGKDKFIGEVKM